MTSHAVARRKSRNWLRPAGLALLTSTCLEHPTLTAREQDAAAGAPAAGGRGGNPGGSGGEQAGMGGNAGNGAAATGGGDAGPQTDADAGTETCRDFSTELCMNPTWLAGTVPYARGPDITEELWSTVQTAIDVWHGTAIWDTTLRFVNGPSPVPPGLVFRMADGCGVVSRTADELGFAITGCVDTRHIAREIGVALGLPRLHQRSDRDRTLIMAPRDEFDCSRGEFFDVCPVTAELGPMSSSTLEEWFMFVPARSGESSACTLAPEGDLLYLPRGADPTEPAADCALLVDGSSLELNHDLSSTLEGAALAELYAIPRGWQPARPIGRDDGPDRPVDTRIAPDMNMSTRTTLVRLGNPERLAAVVWASSPENELVVWKIEHDGSAWGGWEPGPRLPANLAAYGLSLSAVSRPGSNAVELFTTAADVVNGTASELFYARIEPNSEASWASLGSVPTLGSPLSAAPSGDEIALYGVHGDAIAVAETDGVTLGAWQPIIPLTGATFGIGSPAVVAHAGRQHVVMAWDSAITYARRDDLGAWSEPVRLAGPVGALNVAIGASPEGRLDVLSMSFGGLWHLSCEAECTSPAAWTRAVAIGGSWTSRALIGESPKPVSVVSWSDAIDIVGPVYSGELLTEMLWHKRWQAR